MLRLLTFIITLASLNFPPLAYGEYESQEALLSHIHAAGFDHVIEISVEDHNFINHYSVDGHSYHQSFRGYKNFYGSVQTEALDFKGKNPNGSTLNYHAFKVGDSFICYTNSLETDHRLFTQKAFGVEYEPEVRGFKTCLIIPVGVDDVIEALSRAPLDIR